MFTRCFSVFFKYAVKQIKSSASLPDSVNHDLAKKIFKKVEMYDILNTKRLRIVQSDQKYNVICNMAFAELHFSGRV